MKLRLATREDWLRLKSHVASLPWKRDDKRLQYVVTIEELKSRRTLEQNARYWALLTEISKQAPVHMGGEWHSPETWHIYCRRRFLGVEPGPFGEGVPKSTAKLGIGAFGDYMTEIEAWAMDRFHGFTFEYQEAA